MYTGGVLEVHDNVVFEANTAGTGDGGAVSLPFSIGCLLHFSGAVAEPPEKLRSKMFEGLWRAHPERGNIFLWQKAIILR